MNIIVPEEENVDSVVLDIRSLSQGEYLGDDTFRDENSFTPSQYTAFLFYIPRNLFVNKGQKADFKTICANIKANKIPKVREYVKCTEFLEQMSNICPSLAHLWAHTSLLRLAFDPEHIEVIMLPKNKRLLVPAPLGKDAVQLIEVSTSSPFPQKESYYGKVCHVENSGVCLTADLDRLVKRINKRLENLDLEPNCLLAETAQEELSL